MQNDGELDPEVWECAQKSAGEHKKAQKSAGECRRAQKSAGECRRAQKCAGVRNILTHLDTSNVV